MIVFDVFSIGGCDFSLPDHEVLKAYQMEMAETCHDGDLTYSSVAEVLKAEFICEFTDRHGVGKILLIRKHQQNGIFQLLLRQLNEQKKCGYTNMVKNNMPSISPLPKILNKNISSPSYQFY